jgi:hypothetical protein
MATLEQDEKLREKANVSFEEAKTALDASNGDLLDAIILLEKQGKMNAPIGGGYYNSKGSASEEKEQAHEEAKSETRRGESFSELLKRFGRFCGRLIGKGNRNYFEAEKNGKVEVSVPVTLLVIAVVFFFWIVFPLAVVGLFFGFRYRFRGDDLGKESVNKVMDSATDTAESIKKSFGGENK